MINAITLIGILLNNHGLEWILDPFFSGDELGTFRIKEHEDVVEVNIKTLVVRFFPDYLTWHSDQASLKICLFDSGSEKLVERYMRFIRGPSKFQK